MARNEFGYNLLEDFFLHPHDFSLALNANVQKTKLTLINLSLCSLFFFSRLCRPRMIWIVEFPGGFLERL